MNTLLWICWVIDILLLLICLYETFAVSSNSSMGGLAFMLVVLLGLSWWLRASSPKWSLALAAVPAGLTVLFVGVWFLTMLGRKNWQ
ncbi:MAG: hypothetical protein IPM82_10115 [Saprospiraceae bacterium]|nr:hypothetical protein [Saprospiraceae bacterium]